MCLILLGFRAHRHFPLVVAANRDEHHARPATPAGFWNDHPAIYAGRDLEQGGTWMGISTRGRFAAITNFRQGRPAAAAPRSRGELVRCFLAGDAPAAAYLSAIDTGRYNPFSLVAGTLDGLHFFSSHGAGPTAIAPGVHGLSNHLLNTPWPKVVTGTKVMDSTLRLDDPDAIAATLFGFLAEREPAADADLPDTGIDRQRERELSAPFIVGSGYGTRTSTLLMVHTSGEVFVHEKRYGPDGVPQGEDARAFRLEKPFRMASG
jgi:uncharacterized protein with NRDE domain